MIGPKQSYLLYWAIGIVIFASVVLTDALDRFFTHHGVYIQVLLMAMFGGVAGGLYVIKNSMADEVSVWHWRPDTFYAVLFFGGIAVATSFLTQFVTYIVKNWWAIKAMLVL